MQGIEFRDNSFELTNMIRGIAIIGIVIHHWFLYLPYQIVFPIISPFVVLISKLAGTYVQIFFLLSGYGLSMSYYKKGIASWPNWFKKRFIKIIIPYWFIVILSFIVMNLLKGVLPINSFTLMDLSAYILLFRNMYPPSHSLNYTFWFMPVLFGLYIIFPFLIKTTKKVGIVKFVIFISILQYGSITSFLLLGFPFGHQHDWFLFYILIFSVGIVLAHVTYMGNYKIDQLGSYKMLLIGCACYLVSFLIQKYFKFGSFYNDVFTAVGIFLITLFICKIILKKYQNNISCGSWNYSIGRRGSSFSLRIIKSISLLLKIL